MKPIMLLDVDGVLNCPGEDAKERLVRLPSCGRRDRHSPGGRCCAGRAFHPTDFTKPFLKWAFQRFDVRWMTAWGDHANNIARWGGVRPVPEAAHPREPQRPWAHRFDGAVVNGSVSNPKWGPCKVCGRKRPQDGVCFGESYKFRAAQRLASTKREVVWIEDGIQEEERAWVACRENWLYVETDPFVGVTVDHCVQIALWLETELAPPEITARTRALYKAMEAAEVR